MTKYTRKKIQVFAENTPTGVFGTAPSGGVTSTDIDVIQSNPAYNAGWASATVSGEKLPSLEDLDTPSKTNSYHIAHIAEKGIPEYGVDTEYYINDFTKAEDSTLIYYSLTDNNLGNPLTDTTNWALAGDLKDISGDNTNYILNGNFDIWRLGTSLTGLIPGDYLADNWRVGGDAAATFDVSKQTSTDPFFDYVTPYLHMEATVGGVQDGARQDIQDVRKLVNTNVTVSFDAKTDDANVGSRYRLRIGFNITESTGTDDFVGDLPLVIGTDITSNWQSFSTTFTIDGTSVTNIEDTDSTSSLTVFFQKLDTEGYNLDVTNIKVEIGRKATEFKPTEQREEIKKIDNVYPLIGNSSYLDIRGLNLVGDGAGTNTISPFYARDINNAGDIVMPTTMVWNFGLTWDGINPYSNPGLTLNNGDQLYIFAFSNPTTLQSTILIDDNKDATNAQAFVASAGYTLYRRIGFCLYNNSFYQLMHDIYWSEGGFSGVYFDYSATGTDYFQSVSLAASSPTSPNTVYLNTVPKDLTTTIHKLAFFNSSVANVEIVCNAYGFRTGPSITTSNPGNILYIETKGFGDTAPSPTTGYISVFNGLNVDFDIAMLGMYDPLTE